MKTNRTLWTWLMDVLAPTPVTASRIAQEPRKIVPMDTPQAFSIQELRWA